jgi:hypothetical protein
MDVLRVLVMNPWTPPKEMAELLKKQSGHFV